MEREKERQRELESSIDKIVREIVAQRNVIYKMTATLHVSFNLLILYRICDMAKKNLDFRNYFYVKDSIIDFTTFIGGQFLYKTST